MLPLLFCALIASTPTQGWDRVPLSEALERLIATGEPRHVDHDEGQVLQAALTAALARADDPELRVLATRAAIPLIPTTGRPLSTVRDLPSVEVRAHRVLELPWSVRYTADIEGRVDSGAWRRLTNIDSDTAAGSTLDRLLPREGLEPGFHTLQLRARIQYQGKLPRGMARRETRTLPTQYYAIWNDTQTTYPGAAVAAYVDRGRFASVAALEPGLPDVPLAIWLMRFPMKQGTDIYWNTSWCENAQRTEPEHMPSDVCVVATFGTPAGPFADVWVRIGRLEREADPVRWTAAPPTLHAAYLHAPQRAPVSLSMMAGLINTDPSQWPGPQIVVRDSDVVVMPDVPRPGQPTSVRVSVWNNGSAPAYGVRISIDAGSTERGLLSREFIRDIPAGDHVELQVAVPFTRPFGWVLVLPMPFADHAEFPATTDEQANGHPLLKVVNRDAMPTSLVAILCDAAIGTVTCSR